MTIDQLTVVPNSVTSPQTFNQDMDQHLAQLPTMISQLNAYLAAVASIASGAAFTIPYLFSTATGDTDPGPGAVRLDNTTQNMATTIRVDLLGSDGTDHTTALDMLDASTSTVKGQIALVKTSDPTKWMLFNLTARTTPSGYRDLTVTVVGSSSTNPFANGDSLVLQFSRTGDKGATGSPGASGGGVGGTTITGNVTLTAASPASMTVTPTSPGLYATAGDATTYSKFSNVYAIYNAGDYDYGFKDNSGVVIGWIKPKTGAIIGLADNTTAAGVWSPIGLDKKGVTALFSSATATIGASGVFIRIAIDSTRTAFLFGTTTAILLVHDASNNTWGAPTVILSGLSSGIFTGILNAANQIIVIGFDPTNPSNMLTQVVTITGTSIAFNGNSTTSLTGVTPTAFLSSGAIVMVGTSVVLTVAGAGGTAPKIIGIGIAAGSPTVGTPLTCASYTNMLFASGGTIVRCVSWDGSVITIKPYTVSGGTLTPGTAATVAQDSSWIKAYVNGNGNIVFSYTNTTQQAGISKLTGTVEAITTVNTTLTAVTAQSQLDLLVMGSNKTGLLTSTATGVGIVALTDTAGTVSTSTAATRTVSGSVGGSAWMNLIGTTAKAIASSSSVIYYFTVDLSGANPTISDAKQITHGGSGTQAYLTANPSNYVLRQPNLLVNGSSGLLMNTGINCALETSFNGSDISKRPASSNTGAVPINGAAANDAWLNSPSMGATGIVLQHVELAA